MDHPSPTFAQFMEDALYGPEGYYSSGKARSGKVGDYFTAVDTGPVFGKLLAALFQEWRRLSGWETFHLLEAAAAEGDLAQMIASALPKEHFPYIGIEKSPVRQKRFLEKTGFEVFADFQSLPNASRGGCLFANELIDAFPVHRVRMHNGKLQELYVQNRNEKFEEGWGELSTPRLSAYFERLNIQLPEGYHTEVNLMMRDWLQEASKSLQKGLMVLIDYGRVAEDYYAPERTQGTLRAFHQHQVSDQLLAYPGEQDLTADVDFTSLALDAKEVGWEPIAFYELGSFLRLGAEKLSFDGWSAKENRALQYVLHPEGMGGTFHVLVLGKEIPDALRSFFVFNRIQRLGLSRLGSLK